MKKDYESRLKKLEKKSALTTIALADGRRVRVTPQEVCAVLYDAMAHQLSKGEGVDVDRLRLWAGSPEEDQGLAQTAVVLARRALEGGPLSEEEIEEIKRSCQGDL
jgi:hypothetical protein